jgi:predicted  nucleic acid-binding Zn-ribbon protein
MMEATKSAQEDLKAVMDNVKKVNAQKQQQRANLAKAQQARTSEHPATNTVGTAIDPMKDKIDAPKHKLDSMSEMGETESLRLQMAMDRQSKFMQTLSNIMKKMSETQSAIIGNLK